MFHNHWTQHQPHDVVNIYMLAGGEIVLPKIYKTKAPTLTHLATDRYLSVAPSLASSYSPKSVTWIQSETDSSLSPEQKLGTNFIPASEKKKN